MVFCKRCMGKDLGKSFFILAGDPSGTSSQKLGTGYLSNLIDQFHFIQSAINELNTYAHPHLSEEDLATPIQEAVDEALVLQRLDPEEDASTAL